MVKDFVLQNNGIINTCTMYMYIIQFLYFHGSDAKKIVKYPFLYTAWYLQILE